MALPLVELPEETVPDETGVDLVTPENTRKYIAWIAIGGLFLTLFIIVLGGWLFAGKDIDETLQVLTTSMGTLTGIVGAIVGYYFRNEG